MATLQQRCLSPPRSTLLTPAWVPRHWARCVRHHDATTRGHGCGIAYSGCLQAAKMYAHWISALLMALDRDGQLSSAFLVELRARFSQDCALFTHPLGAAWLYVVCAEPFAAAAMSVVVN